MNYIINGDTVTQLKYERECEDNFNASVRFSEDYDESSDTLSMNYDLEKEA